MCSIKIINKIFYFLFYPQSLKSGTYFTPTTYLGLAEPHCKRSIASRGYWPPYWMAGQSGLWGSSLPNFSCIVQFLGKLLPGCKKTSHRNQGSVFLVRIQQDWEPGKHLLMSPSPMRPRPVILSIAIIGKGHGIDLIGQTNQRPGAGIVFLTLAALSGKGRWWMLGSHGQSLY